MIPELLKDIKEVKEVRVKNLLAFHLDGNIAIIPRHKVRKIVGILNLGYVEKTLKEFKEEGLINSYMLGESNYFKIEVNSERVIDFLQLKAYYTDETEMMGVNALSGVSYIKFWLLVKDSGYEDFTINAEELGKYIGIQKYQFAQTLKKDNNCYLDRLTSDMNKAGFFMKYEFVNGKNIRQGIKFIFYKYKDELKEQGTKIILNKINSFNLGKVVNEQEQKDKQTIARKLRDVFESENESPVCKRIIQKLTNEEKETLLYYLLKNLCK